MYRRLNLGDLLMQLSHLPKTIYVTQLKVENGELSLSGLVRSQDDDPKVLVNDLIEVLGKYSLYNIELVSLKGNEMMNAVSEFVIKAKLAKE